MTATTFSAARHFVSPEFFEIATCAIAECSNKTYRFQSLRSVVGITVELLENHEFSAEHFHTFKASTSLKGDIPVYLKLTAEVSESTNILKQKLSKISDIQVYDRTAVAYFMAICLDKNLY
jgi:hypothetical protein